MITCPTDKLQKVLLSGGCKQNGTPSPDTPIDIVCNNGVVKVSPNLYNLATRTDEYYIGADGTIAQGSRTFCYSALIPVKPNTNYMLSGTAGQTDIRRLHAYDSSGNWISQVSFANTTVRNTYNITGTTPNNCAYIRISIPMLDTNVQVEQGSSATPYMPYGQIYTDGTQEVVTDNLGNTANAEILLKVGNYQDVQSILDGVVTRSVAVKVLDGTEDWNNQNTINCWSTTANNLVPISETNRTVYCNYFKSTSTLPSMGNRQGYCFKGHTDSSSHISFGSIAQFPTVTEWNNWLADQYAAGTPVIVVYPLVTPTTEQVTPQLLAGSSATVTAGSIDNLPIESSTIAELKKRYIGDKEVKKVYIGSNLVWSAE